MYKQPLCGIDKKYGVFSSSWKIMAEMTFSEPQPKSASYLDRHYCPFPLLI